MACTYTISPTRQIFKNVEIVNGGSPVALQKIEFVIACNFSSVFKSLRKFREGGRERERERGMPVEEGKRKEKKSCNSIRIDFEHIVTHSFQCGSFEYSVYAYNGALHRQHG